jgi:hypothetical protein
MNNIKSPRELLEFMDKNINYGFVGKNGKKYLDPYSPEWNDWYNECFVQTGEEILKSKIGTCWDQVELEREWFFKHNYKFKTYFICFDIEENHSTHTFLVYEDNNKYYWFENSWAKYRGIHEYNSIDELLESIISKFVLDHNEVSSSAELYLYKYNIPFKHIGCNEFYKYIETQELVRKK